MSNDWAARLKRAWARLPNTRKTDALAKVKQAAEAEGGSTFRRWVLERIEQEMRLHSRPFVIPLAEKVRERAVELDQAIDAVGAALLALREAARDMWDSSDGPTRREELGNLPRKLGTLEQVIAARLAFHYVLRQQEGVFLDREARPPSAERHFAHCLDQVVAPVAMRDVDVVLEDVPEFIRADFVRELRDIIQEEGMWAKMREAAGLSNERLAEIKALADKLSKPA